MGGAFVFPPPGRAGEHGGGQERARTAAGRTLARPRTRCPGWIPLQARYCVPLPMSTKPSLRQVLTNPRTWPLLALGFSSGLPLLLVGGTLSIWMKNEGLNIKTITAFGL